MFNGKSIVPVEQEGENLVTSPRAMSVNGNGRISETPSTPNKKSDKQTNGTPRQKKKTSSVAKVRFRAIIEPY